MKAPFPWFGGKSRAAALIWERFGDPVNYVEPFAGSLAVLLGRPTPPRTETVNDLDCYLANFWRAVKHDPAAVAKHADWPVNEVDLHARHRWLMVTGQERIAALRTDPNFYDAQVAGWWVWRISAERSANWARGDVYKPLLGCNNGTVALRADGKLQQAIHGLASRLAHVRVCCGNWDRVLTPTATYQHGLTAILLDPPYADTAQRDPDIYRQDSLSVAHDVRKWAIDNGDNPLLRIALCGYEGEHAMPDLWECVPWAANGGYSNHSGNQNRHRERIWFSPACLRPAITPRAMNLFDLDAA